MTGEDSFLVNRAQRFHGRTAIIDGSTSWPYDAVDAAASHVARAILSGREALNEDRVAYLVAPGASYVCIQWGIWRAGGVAVPLPVGHSLRELEQLVIDCGASSLVSDAAHLAVGQELARRVDIPLHQASDLLQPSPAMAPLPALAPAARAMILYTSGTTGRPKGVVSTHAAISAQIASLVTAWEWSPGDRTLLVLPLHHVHGIINVVSCALWSGAQVEMLPKFDAEATWQRLAAGELTVFTAVPTIYHRLIESWERADPATRQRRSAGCRALRLMMSGSAPLPVTMLQRWREISGHVLLERYGMTEVGMALSNPLHGERRPGHVGTPLPGVAARIVDGELQLRGPGVFREYWQQPGATRDAFVDGWFRTGDLAVLDDGSYRLLGRASVDIIKSGGDKISALEIEEVLRLHPAIAECAVVGVADSEWGERVCCAAELRSGHTLDVGTLREWARARLAPSKLPRELRCVERLPRNAMGKIVKRELATLFAPPVPPARRAPSDG